MQVMIRIVVVVCLCVPLSTFARADQKDAGKETSESAQVLASKAMAIMERQTHLSSDEQLQLDECVLGALRSEPINAKLLLTYGTFYIHSVKTAKAIEMAKSAAEFNAEYNLEYAQLCKLAGREHHDEMLKAARAAEIAFSVKMGTKAETDRDRLGLARSLVILDERETAIEVLEKGLSNARANPPIMVGELTGLYVEKFRKENAELLKSRGKPSETQSNSAQNVPSVPPVDWTYIHKAAKIDQNNPKLGVEIVQVWRHWAEPPEELLKVLREQLENNIANTPTRLLMAEMHLLNAKTDQAKAEWEKILAKEPNIVPALNNLAVILSRESPPQSDRALELIEQADRVSPKNAEICDSYGEIFMNVGRAADAIPKFEEVLRLQPDRIGTRKKLVKCYREIGDDLRADGHQEAIDRNKTKLEN
jgi:tetratricopeptide (TPR) repeat protein